MEKASDAPVSSPPVKCLYVEHDLDPRQSASFLEMSTMRHITNRTFAYIVVLDGFSALECTEHTIFDVIMVHKDLPHMAGVEVLRILRSAGNHTPVILVVNEADGVSDEEAMYAGFSGVLRKPYTSLQLCTNIVEATSTSCVKPNDTSVQGKEHGHMLKSMV
jgi:CheY-like chemotaxis protein